MRDNAAAIDALVCKLGIVATAGVCHGEPRVSGHRVPVSILAARFREGESMADIAKDYGLSLSVVEDAIRFACLPRRTRMRWHERQLERQVAG